ncbi:MAG: DUF1579 domain-containing protein [Planctomycetota bacterium]
MKELIALLLLVSCSATGANSGAATADAASLGAPPSAELHPYLQRLVGDWSIHSEVTAGTDGSVIKMDASESVEAMGPWIVSRIRSGGESGGFEARLAFAYDASAEGFVGFWVDSSSSRMWTYRCWLDSSGSVLTAEAEGPAFDDPSRLALFQDITEFDGADRRLLRSRMQRADGEWTDFSSGVAVRIR